MEKQELDTKAQQRIQLAQEVLLGLESGVMLPSQGQYVEVMDKFEFWLNYTVRPLERINGYACKVCGCGSLVVAAVRRGLAGKEDTVLGLLSNFFDPLDIFRIEAVFMGKGFDNFLNGVPNEYKVVDGFGDLLEDEFEDVDFAPWWNKFNIGECDEVVEEKDLADVLRAVMKNIIRNNGNFDVKDPVDVG